MADLDLNKITEINGLIAENQVRISKLQNEITDSTKILKSLQRDNLKLQEKLNKLLQVKVGKKKPKQKRK